MAVWIFIRISELRSKILPFDKKNHFLFCILLTYSYLCIVILKRVARKGALSCA